jgi:hypothetical protein
MQKAAAMNKHYGKAERAKYQHENEHIDKQMIHLNSYIGCNDYSDAYKAMRANVQKLDELHPPERRMKDRVVAFMLETACPQSIIDAGRSEEFFKATHELMQDFFGETNVHGTFVHRDEVHSYVDSKTKEVKTSLEHGTTLITAYAEWQQKKTVNGEKVEIDRKGVNGKNCSTKAHITQLNKRMNDMVRERFGCEYNTGEVARQKSVEQLKNESGQIMAEQARDAAVEALRAAERDRDATEQARDAAAKELIEIQSIPDPPEPPIPPTTGKPVPLEVWLAHNVPAELKGHKLKAKQKEETANWNKKAAPWQQYEAAKSKYSADIAAYVDKYGILNTAKKLSEQAAASILRAEQREQQAAVAEERNKAERKAYEEKAAALEGEIMRRSKQIADKRSAKEQRRAAIKAKNQKYRGRVERSFNADSIGKDHADKDSRTTPKQD